MLTLIYSSAEQPCCSYFICLFAFLVFPFIFIYLRVFEYSARDCSKAICESHIFFYFFLNSFIFPVSVVEEASVLVGLLKGGSDCSCSVWILLSLHEGLLRSAFADFYTTMEGLRKMYDLQCLFCTLHGTWARSSYHVDL